MNNFKLFKHTKKYLIIVFILLFTFTLASCKKKNPDDGGNKNPLPVTITTTTDKVFIDTSETITVDATLQNASDGIILWSSNDESILTINPNGLVTPVNVGITTIKASYSQDKNISTSIKVYVSNNSERLYPIEFDLNGGIYDGVLPDTYSTFVGISNLPTPSKDDHEFVGWFNENGEQVTKITNSNRGPISLTANYNHFPTAISIKEINEDLWVGKTYDLQVKAVNEMGGYKYTSSNENVVTINNDGEFTCLSTGTAEITVTSLVNENTKAKISVNVKYSIPTGFELTRNITSIKLGTTTTLKVKGTNTTGYPGVTWTSLTPEIASIDKYGVVKTNTNGQATFRATSLADESVYTDFNIEILLAATSVKINTPENTSLYIGDTINLTALVFPSTVDQDVTWQTSDKNIATIDENGKLEIIDRGTVTIFAVSNATSGISDKIVITALHELLNEEISDVKYIICAPGTDASTMISINYHAMSTKTYIEYTLASDPNFENATKYYAEGRYFEETDPILAVPFPARNIYSAEITGLTPSTDYIYRINGGDGTVSETYHFKTASATRDNFSFVWLSDNHYNTIYEGAETSEQTIQKAIEMRGEISFVFDTGDMIDTGGNADIWTKMFEQRHTLKNLPLVSTTGNHELYVNGTGQWDNRFHSAYNALPKNGVEGQVGTSCYFIYNGVMFILIENVSAKSYNEQLAWMEELLRSAREENKAKMIVVGMHAPIQDPNKADRDETMTGLFDKYGVELVLTGHYHTHQVKRNYYEGQVQNDPLLGVNYMIGTSSGAKGAGDGADLGEFAKGYVVDIIDNSIKVTYINANGRVLGEYTFNSINYEEMTNEQKNASKQDIIDSLQYTVDPTLGTIEFRWSSLAYGNVEKIKFNEQHRGDANQEVYIISPSYTKKTVTGIYNNYDSEYLVEFYFKDGSVETVEIPIILSTDINLEATIKNQSIKLSFDELNSNIMYIVKYVEIYLDGELIENVPYNTGTRYLTSYVLENVDVTKPHDIEVKFLNNKGKTIISRSTSINK